MHKILIVEDEPFVLEAYRATLANRGVAVVSAMTLVEAMAVVGAAADFEAVFVDGCFPHGEGGAALPEPGKPCNGEKFVVWLRGPRVRYAGPILACSASSEFNDRMVACGATRTVLKGKGVCDAVDQLFPDAR